MVLERGLGAQLVSEEDISAVLHRTLVCAGGGICELEVALLKGG